LTFPDNENSPSQRTQPLHRGAVSLDIPLEFGGPELGIVLWRGRTVTPAMPMPKTPMHENNTAQARKYDIRSTWKIAAMKPESEPHRVSLAAHNEFRLRILTAHSRHHAATRLWRNGIHGRKCYQPERRAAALSSNASRRTHT
jgi:hypothetical protein